MNTARPLALFSLAGCCAIASGDVGIGDRVPLISPRDGVINLRSGDVDSTTLPDLLAGEVLPTRGLIRLDGPMSPARREALRTAGAEPVAYFPTNFFLADLTGTTPAKLRALPFVRGVVEYRREWKLDAHLKAGANPHPWQTPARVELAAQGRVAANIWLFSGAAPDAALAALGAIPGVMVSGVDLVSGSHSIGIILPAESIAALTDVPDVQYAEPFPEYTPRSNATTRWVIQSNQTSVTPLYARGITGVGQVVGIIDGWVARSHCAFNDPINPVGPLHRKILAYNAVPSYDFHGTHVAGTAVGNDNTNGNNRGIAYGAKMVFNTWPDVNEQSNYDRFTLHVSQGARVHCNSWGADWIDAYDGGCRAIDTVQRESEESLILFAVSDSAFIHNPENAKNSLAVTASNNNPNENTMCFGGIGPTLDGRRKPEVAAPGCAISSSTGNGGCATTSASGTSMACPAVTGLAALVREYYMRGFYPSGAESPADALSPTGSLLKATLINSGQDMTGVPDYPNFREGWGRVLADATLYFAGDVRRLLVRDVRNASAEALSTGQSFLSDFSVDAADQALRVTMVYADVPAEVNASFAPVNDLDLTLTSPTGEVYRGNVFAGGFSTTGGDADIRNNTEQVHLVAPSPGRWRIEVSGRAVNIGTQGFALVITGAVSEVPCIGDFNRDGGADGADVEAFFNAWETGDPAADIDENGGIDGADVEAFFAAWQSGC
ncbi:MAG: S8 family serine peptidase [Phycisphaerae bacterium]|nr:S8 family serine peptidase [Phycisphaerae bacterium]